MTAPRPTQSSRRETAEVAIDPEPVRAPPAAAEQVRAQPVARPPAVAPAVPPMAAAAAPVDEAAAKVAQKQISDGYRLLRAGFVKKAREKFELAMKADAPEASLGQGRSMDPSYLKTVAFPDVIPDAEQARRMYRRAILLGNTEAKGDLERLEKVMAAAQPVTDTETPAASSPPSSLSPSTPANAAPVKPE